MKNDEKRDDHSSHCCCVMMEEVGEVEEGDVNHNELLRDQQHLKLGEYLKQVDSKEMRRAESGRVGGWGESERSPSRNICVFYRFHDRWPFPYGPTQQQ
jgi:hypothetical protein